MTNKNYEQLHRAVKKLNYMLDDPHEGLSTWTCLFDDAIHDVQKELYENRIVNKKMKEIGRLIKTQDNRITDQPIFVVEESKLIITDPDYGYDAEEWVNMEGCDYETASETKARRLDALAEDFRDTGKWKKFFYKETWEFLTACFTESGCIDYLRLNGHRLGKTRIYAYGNFRNYEYQSIRKFLLEQDESN